MRLCLFPLPQANKGFREASGKHNDPAEERVHSRGVRQKIEISPVIHGRFRTSNRLSRNPSQCDLNLLMFESGADDAMSFH